MYESNTISDEGNIRLLSCLAVWLFGCLLVLYFKKYPHVVVFTYVQGTKLEI